MLLSGFGSIVGAGAAVGAGWVLEMMGNEGDGDVGVM